MNVTTMNKQQADEFLKKYLQDNITVERIAKDDEDGIYFVDLKSGPLFKRIKTSWQFRPTISFTDQLLGSRNLGLCFGSHTMPGTNKRFDVYEHTDELLTKASRVTWQAIRKWEGMNPIDFNGYEDESEKVKSPENTEKEELQKNTTSTKPGKSLIWIYATFALAAGIVIGLLL